MQNRWAEIVRSTCSGKNLEQLRSVGRAFSAPFSRGSCYAEIGRQSCGTRPQTRQDAVPIFALSRREVSRSTDATSFPPQPSRGPGLLAHALRVVCIAQLAH